MQHVLVDNSLLTKSAKWSGINTGVPHLQYIYSALNSSFNTLMMPWHPPQSALYQIYWIRLYFSLSLSNHMKDPVAPCRALVCVWVKSGSGHEQLVQDQHVRRISAQSCRPSQAKLILPLSHYRIFCLSAAQLAQSGQRNTDAHTHQAGDHACFHRTAHIQTSKNQLKAFSLNLLEATGISRCFLRM